MSEGILEEAQRIVHGARRETHGHPLDNHSRTAALWTAFLGHPVTAEDVCWMNILQKASRTKASGIITRDSLVDTAGYAANIEILKDERARRG